jgi:hypothetical protein
VLEQPILAGNQEAETTAIVASAAVTATGRHLENHSAFAAGCLSGRGEARIATVLKDAERAYSRFAKARPFW